jgi:hypothetical protein
MFNVILNLIISLTGAAVFFLAGWFWSSSAQSHHPFDLGWLVVALMVARVVSRRIEGGSGQINEYLLACLWGAPGFVFEFLADWGVREFGTRLESVGVILYVVFSCGLLVYVTIATAMMRLGIRIDGVGERHEVTWRARIWTGAIVVVMTCTVGAVYIALESARAIASKIVEWQSWFHFVSLIAYALLTIKMTAPFISMRVRNAKSEFRHRNV